MSPPGSAPRRISSFLAYLIMAIKKTKVYTLSFSEMKIIKSFKNNKAQDYQGLAAEHLKFSPDSVSYYFADILNYIMRTGYVPKQLKEWVLTPVLKVANILPSLLVIEELWSFFLYCNTPSRGLHAGGMHLKATVQKVYGKRNE